MPAAPTGSRVGSASTRKRSRATSAKAAGANHGREAVFEYCEEDVRASTLLLRKQLRGPRHRIPPADVARVLHWSNYSAKAVAQIQARGMPIDMPLWNLVQENKTAVIGTCCDGSIRATAATIRSTRPRASGATPV